MRVSGNKRERSGQRKREKEGVRENVTNGKILTFCRLQVKVGWDSYLTPADGPDLDIPPSLSAHGIGMEKTEFGEIVTKVSGIIRGTNKLPWLLSAQPLAALLLAGTLWLPAFIAVLVVHVDDDSGSKSLV
ncbi:hypothetical protein BgiBS90_025385 [Biomphalaria glabrata]|nr:hypothetical protein BgiBS90_025385 [Biomphalaria glabrata]